MEAHELSPLWLFKSMFLEPCRKVGRTSTLRYGLRMLVNILASVLM